MERWQAEFDAMLFSGGQQGTKTLPEFDSLAVKGVIDDYLEDTGELPDVYDVRDTLDYPNEYDDQIEVELMIYERDDSRWQKI